jgi:hypothetical protein
MEALLLKAIDVLYKAPGKNTYHVCSNIVNHRHYWGHQIRQDRLPEIFLPTTNDVDVSQAKYRDSFEDARIETIEWLYPQLDPVKVLEVIRKSSSALREIIDAFSKAPYMHRYLAELEAEIKKR